MIENIIFDFYGTLVDIHTDESQPELWQKMRDLYAVYGADYEAEELHQTYLDFCREEEAEMKKETGNPYPEIDLLTVFGRLYEAAPEHHPTELQKDVNEELFVFLANTFRILSRTKLCAYPHTLEVLKALKDRGYHLYLLSNAQHVFTMPEMEETGVLPYMDAVYISSDAGVKKPQKAFMEKLLKEQKLKKETCLMVGNDMDSDIRIAALCGMKSLFLNTFAWSDDTMEEKLKELQKEVPGYQPVISREGEIEEVMTCLHG
jgi:putative hydrolase of the HAD superfamily